MTEKDVSILNSILDGNELNNKNLNYIETVKVDNDYEEREFSYYEIIPWKDLILKITKYRDSYGHFITESPKIVKAKPVTTYTYENI